jgi:serine/threonine protein kinase
MNCPNCQVTNPSGSRACAHCGTILVAPPTRRSVFAARYEFLEAFGTGTVGTVYKALDRVRDEIVAVKVLSSDLLRTAARDDQFRADMTVAQTVQHRNLCHILHFGEYDGHLYYVMECVDGLDAKQLIRRSALPLEQAFDIALQTSLGLQALHGARLLHQDIKTRNIMIDPQGLVRLMDFGVAREWVGGTTTVSFVGRTVGGTEYLSPENARGVPADVRSDVYSLGVVIYELFTGQLPFRGATPIATALKHVQEPPPLEGPRAARIPDTVIPILRKALAKNPDRRHASAEALSQALTVARGISCASSRIAPSTIPGPIPALLGALNPVDATIRFKAPIMGADPASRHAIPVLIDALGKKEREPVADEQMPPGPLDSLLEPAVHRGPDGDAVHGRTADPPPVVATPASVGVLVNALQSPDHSIRAKAAHSLGGIGPGAKDAIPVLLDALRDREASVRWGAARALGQIGAAAADGLAAAVNDKDPEVRKIVAEALKQIIERKKKGGG